MNRKIKRYLQNILVILASDQKVTQKYRDVLTYILLDIHARDPDPGDTLQLIESRAVPPSPDLDSDSVQDSSRLYSKFARNGSSRNRIGQE